MNEVIGEPNVSETRECMDFGGGAPSRYLSGGKEAKKLFFPTSGDIRVDLGHPLTSHLTEFLEESIDIVFEIRYRQPRLECKNGGEF